MPLGTKMCPLLLPPPPLLLCLLLLLPPLGCSPNRDDPAFSPVASIQPRFEDANGTRVYGEPGASVTMDCNVFMLQDHTVSQDKRETRK